MKINEEKIKEILGRNVEQIITEKELWKKLHSGKQLRIKHGVDVTNSMLHLGHAVNYWKMREFQELGHKVVFLIGDFTTQIGDPTSKSKTRPEISHEQITKFQTLYKNRFGREINQKEAYEQGAKLLRLVELIYKPMTEPEYLCLQKRRQETGLNFKKETKNEIN